MTTALTAAMQAALAANSGQVAHLLQIDWDGGAQYLTSHYRNVDWNGQTWLADGNLLSVGDAEEASASDLARLEFTLSGVALANVAAALNGTWYNRAATLYRAMIDLTTGEVVPNPVVRFSGLLDSHEIEEDPARGNSTIRWVAVSEFADFDRVAGRSTSDDMQQLFSPGDRGMELAHVELDDVPWGRL